MSLPQLSTDRFTPETGLRITVQVPEPHVAQLVEAILTHDALIYGDYDRVTFRTAPGIQQFRALGTGRNAVTDDTVEVPCTELSVFVQNNSAATATLIEAIYAAHPYEEPVIFVQETLRCLHIRGMDEHNPNRFWNAGPQDWVPEEHR